MTSVYFSLLGLLIVVQLVTATDQYFVVPLDSTALCQDYPDGTCFTLDQLSSQVNETYTGNITISFLPGEHLLTWNMRFDGEFDVTLNSKQMHNLSVSWPTISCVNARRFQFNNLRALTLEGVSFVGCDGGDTARAIIASNVKSVSISNCHFGNMALGGGAMYILSATVVDIRVSTFTSNVVRDDQALCEFNLCNGGALLILLSKNVSVESCIFQHNRAQNGGAFNLFQSNLIISNTSFHNNSATIDGGAVNAAFNSNLSLSECLFLENNAGDDGGGILASDSKIFFDSCIFESNRAVDRGGIYSRSSPGTNVLNTTFRGNIASDGGGIYLDKSPATVSKSYFTNNTAIDDDGGAVVVRSTSNATIHSCVFVSNYALDSGGAIDIVKSKISVTNSTFEKNSAGQGGAVAIRPSSSVVFSANTILSNTANFTGGGIYATEFTECSSLENVYSGNTARLRGGAIFSHSNPLVLVADNFTHNRALEGAAVFQDPFFGAIQAIMQVTNCIFTSNQHLQDGLGTVYASQTFLTFNDSVLANNYGSLHIVNSEVEISGDTIFCNNTNDFGGAITCRYSSVVFKNSSTTIINGNQASYGGGMALTQCTVRVNGELVVMENTANVSGGGMYAFHSSLLSDPSHRGSIELPLIANNTAGNNGGGIYLSGSNVQISKSHLTIVNNTAKEYGGGLYLEETSNIDLLVEVNNEERDFPSRLNLRGNSALRGGGIFVADSASEVKCDGISSAIEASIGLKQCFIQILQLHSFPLQSSFVRVYFEENFAADTGSNIYGGLLDRCTIDPFAEVAAETPHFNKFYNGVMFLKTVAHFDSAEGGAQNPVPLYGISSDPVRTCFCERDFINCNSTPPTLYRRKGETFTLQIVSVDQMANPVNASVISSYKSTNGTIGRLKEGQHIRAIGNRCSELEYNVYATGDRAVIEIYADGPCGNQGISSLEMQISFLPCECPIGFEAYDIDSTIDCVCDCDRQLLPYISNCVSTNSSIRIDSNTWIKYDNTSNVSGFVVQSCTFDYCVKRPITINLDSEIATDEQCAFNRTGTLCGQCAEGLSLGFASSKCRECSNYYLFLILPFAVAGIALVAFILLLKMTVATGTIHGLILYANILAANRSIFLPFDSPNFLTVFISWLNLDLGIETCFYDGMDSYGKFLLQLVFPVYVFILIGITVELSNRYEKFAHLIGRTNPEAALYTLILLSYSKLTRIIITALQFAIVSFPDGTQNVIWLYDGNVAYFSQIHVPRFLLAILILFLGSIYTMLLTFGHLFPKCSRYKVMRWASHRYYFHFLKAHHAPLVDKHRYWIGVLVNVRLIHFLISAFSTDSTVVLSASVLILVLIVYKQFVKQIYKSWAIDLVETSFLVNVLFLAVSTFYVWTIGGSQQTLALISLSISFATFIGIILYHITLVCGMKLERVPTKLASFLKRHEGNKAKQTNKPISTSASNTADTNASTSASDQYNSELREPALDELAPVRPEDYDTMPSPQEPGEQVTTYAEICI